MKKVLAWLGWALAAVAGALVAILIGKRGGDGAKQKGDAARAAEKKRLDGMSDAGVVDAAGAGDAVKRAGDGAVADLSGRADRARAEGEAGVDAAQQRLGDAADEARDRLRRASSSGRS